MGFQGSPSATSIETGGTSGGLSGWDVLGLPLDVVQGIYKGALDRSDKNLDNTLRTINTLSNANAQSVTASWHQKQIDQLDKAEQDDETMHSYLSKISNDPQYKGTVLGKWAPTLTALPARVSGPMIREILKGEVTNKTDTLLSMMQEDQKDLGPGHFRPETQAIIDVLHPKKESSETEKAWKNSAIDRTVAGLFYPKVKENIQNTAGKDMKEVAAMLEALNNKAGTGGVNTETFRAYLSPEDAEKMDAVRAAMMEVHAAGGSAAEITAAGMAAFKGVSTESENYKMPSMKGSPQDIAAALATFPDADRATMADIMKRESNGVASAIGINKSGKHKGSFDSGLFQINDQWIPELIRVGIINKADDLLNAKINARAAAYIKNKQGISAWDSSAPGNKSRFIVREVK
jgi:hypothetical protein